MNPFETLALVCFGAAAPSVFMDSAAPEERLRRSHEEKIERLANTLPPLKGDEQ